MQRKQEIQNKRIGDGDEQQQATPRQASPRREATAPQVVAAPPKRYMYQPSAALTRPYSTSMVGRPTSSTASANPVAIGAYKPVRPAGMGLPPNQGTPLVDKKTVEPPAQQPSPYDSFLGYIFGNRWYSN